MLQDKFVIKQLEKGGNVIGRESPRVCVREREKEIERRREKETERDRSGSNRTLERQNFPAISSADIKPATPLSCQIIEGTRFKAVISYRAREIFVWDGGPKQTLSEGRSSVLDRTPKK